MSLQSIARASFAQIRTLYPESVVEVVSGRTAQGIRDTSTQESSADVMGERGATTGVVRVDASEIDEPGRGATIKVNGVDVFVMSVRTDPAGALLAISYSEQSPIEGV